jgi:hypothetical protein
VIRSAPLTPETCEQVEIVEHLNTEFAFLTDLLYILFPAGVVMEKAYIQDAAASGEQ